MRCDVRRREFFVSWVCALPKMLVHTMMQIHRDKHPRTSVSLSPSPSPFPEEYIPLWEKRLMCLAILFGKEVTSVMRSLYTPDVFSNFLRFIDLAGKGHGDVTHFGDQLRERRGFYSAFLLNWSVVDPLRADWITIGRCSTC